MPYRRIPDSTRRAPEDAPAPALQRSRDEPKGAPAAPLTSADHVLALQRTAGNHAVAQALGRPPASASPVLMRTYKRAGGGGVVTVTDAATEYDDLTAEVNANIACQDIRGRWNLRPREKMVATIERMISGSVRGSFGAIAEEAVGLAKQPNRDWQFRDLEDAARAVLGESFRDVGEQKEARLSQEIRESDDVAPAVLEGVHRYMEKLENYIFRLKAQGFVPANFDGKPGKYGSYYQPVKGLLSFLVTTSPAEVLKHHRDAPFDLDAMIAVIKDITTEFWDWYASTADGTAERTKAQQSIQTPPAKSVAGSPSAFAFMAGVRNIEDVGTTVRPNGILNEKSESMKHARDKMMLVDHGPSFSTGRVLQLGEAIGADPTEQEAVALALFAFWNRSYWRSMSGIHHFHFVMDMLENYVPGRYRYTGYPASIANSMSAELKALEPREHARV